MPFFSIYLPPKLRSHPAFENLKANANKLTSPFDIYFTLLDLLYFDNIREEEFKVLPSRPLKRSLSLLRPIPHDRTCGEAGIEPHWCICVEWRSIMENEKLSQLGNKIVLEVVNVFNGFLEEEKELCAELKLSKIDRMERLVPNEGVLNYAGVKDVDGFQPKFANTKLLKDFVTYRFSFWTEPGSAHYEVTVEHNQGTGELKINKEAISHVNRYGNLPHCVIDRNYFLGSYCVCKDMIKDSQSR